MQQRVYNFTPIFKSFFAAFEKILKLKFDINDYFSKIITSPLKISKTGFLYSLIIIILSLLDVKRVCKTSLAHSKYI